MPAMGFNAGKQTTPSWVKRLQPGQADPYAPNQFSTDPRQFGPQTNRLNIPTANVGANTIDSGGSNTGAAILSGLGAFTGNNNLLNAGAQWFSNNETQDAYTEAANNLLRGNQNAVNTLTGSANRAIDFQGDIYGDTKQNLSPYNNYGRTFLDVYNKQIWERGQQGVPDWNKFNTGNNLSEVGQGPSFGRFTAPGEQEQFNPNTGQISYGDELRNMLGLSGGQGSNQTTDFNRNENTQIGPSFEGDRFKYGAEEFEADPAAAYRRERAMETARRELAAGGFNQSGNKLAALTELSSGLASQEFGESRDRAFQDSHENWSRGMQENQNTANQALQRFGMDVTENQVINQNQQVAFNQLQSALQFGNQAQAQDYLQQLQTTQEQNRAQTEQFRQDLNTQLTNNTIDQQEFQNRMAVVEQNNQVGQEYYNRALQSYQNKFAEKETLYNRDQNLLNRQKGMIDMGMTAANNLATVGAAHGESVGNTITGLGEGVASVQENTGQALAFLGTQAAANQQDSINELLRSFAGGNNGFGGGGAQGLASSLGIDMGTASSLTSLLDGSQGKLPKANAVAQLLGVETGIAGDIVSSYAGLTSSNPIAQAMGAASLAKTFSTIKNQGLSGAITQGIDDLKNIPSNLAGGVKNLLGGGAPVTSIDPATGNVLSGGSNALAPPATTTPYVDPAAGFNPNPVDLGATDPSMSGGNFANTGAASAVGAGSAVAESIANIGGGTAALGSGAPAFTAAEGTALAEGFFAGEALTTAEVGAALEGAGVAAPATLGSLASYLGYAAATIGIPKLWKSIWESKKNVNESLSRRLSQPGGKAMVDSFITGEASTPGGKAYAPSAAGGSQRPDKAYKAGDTTHGIGAVMNMIAGGEISAVDPALDRGAHTGLMFNANGNPVGRPDHEIYDHGKKLETVSFWDSDLFLFKYPVDEEYTIGKKSVMDGLSAEQRALVAKYTTRDDIRQAARAA